jgi:hypothetical protein
MVKNSKIACSPIKSIDYWHNDSNLFNRAKMDSEPIIHAVDYKEEVIRRKWENKKITEEG